MQGGFDLYARADPTALPLSDLGYLARIHPLELWVAGQRLSHPATPLQTLLADSREVMIDVYGWLLRTSRQRAQDVRIKTMLEIEAFQQIHARWHRLGYPFEDLAPSLGTAIGSSGDRPEALAHLMGIIMNDGVNKMAENTAGYPFGYNVLVNSKSRFTDHPVGQVRLNVRASPRAGRIARIGNYQRDQLLLLSSSAPVEYSVSKESLHGGDILDDFIVIDAKGCARHDLISVTAVVEEVEGDHVVESRGYSTLILLT